MIRGDSLIDDQQFLEETMDSKVVFGEGSFHFRVEQVRLPCGMIGERMIVNHPGAVVIAPLTESWELVFVKQYRKAIDSLLLELPAGTLEEGEDPEICAHRELEEETGYRAERMEHMMTFYPSPGYCNEELHLFLAEGLTPGPPHPDQEEKIMVVHYSLEEAFDLMKRQKIKDGKTIIGLREIQDSLGKRSR